VPEFRIVLGRIAPRVRVEMIGKVFGHEILKVQMPLQSLNSSTGRFSRHGQHWG
jgi:hypothetical protein